MYCYLGPSVLVPFSFSLFYVERKGVFWYSSFEGMLVNDSALFVSFCFRLVNGETGETKESKEDSENKEEQ